MASWKVYQWEWVIVYTSDANGDDGKAECEAKFEADYAGKVELWQLHCHNPAYPATLALWLPNLMGEYQAKSAAEAHSSGLHRLGEGEKVELFEHGSAAEEKLLSYGKKKLHT